MKCDHSLFPLKCLTWTKEMTSVPVYTAVYAYRRVSLFSGVKGES